MRKLATLFICGFLFQLIGSGCNNEDPLPDNTLYFPPVSGSTWETSDPAELGWDTEQLNSLLLWLDETDTRAFIILKDGKMVVEHYNGNNLTGTAPFGRDTYWYWASAGKTLTSVLAGIAEGEGKLDLQASSNSYLNEGWSTLTAEQESAIKVIHHLSMTTGLDDGVQDSDCTDPACLVFKAPPGTRWAYHNGPYTLLDEVISQATGTPFPTYFKEKLADPIGMKGQWIKNVNNVFYSDARSMARFGLLILNSGKWNENRVLSNTGYLSSMIESSQTLNKSYGYLWWLNGKESFMVPGLQLVFSGSMAPSAPDDMFSALGKNSQLLHIVPSQGLVVIRMGGNADGSNVPVTYPESLWSRLALVLPSL